MMPGLATIVIMLHSPLMVSVVLAVFVVFTAIIAVFLAFMVEILHPVHMELEFEQVQFNFHARFDSMSWGHGIR